MAIFTQTRLATITAIALLACLVIPLHTMAADAAQMSVDETQQTQAGVMATDTHWSLAEMTGDTAWLDQMLLPEYRSVGNSGLVHAKDAILAGAAKRKGTSLEQAQLKFAEYQRQHPYGSAVVVHGNTAVITFYDPALGPQKGVRSSDVFIYVDGRWHALYSQHTGVDA
ncbi:nuclear transport factor 2 family protein [Dyella sp.]|uniref:nuclear transport factor 2 family protein n=1 Tax=Dyella sp. TaxID=1869338 RepID=UPI002B48B420|nr:nuclear transport factor 2 family protein [Dyella sp.]HKT27199.1 nuclear transport factor 2 family protein [Dyella sp.]